MTAYAEQTASRHFAAIVHTQIHAPINKKKERKETPRFEKSPICRDHQRRATRTKVIMCGGVPDVVNHDKFHKNRFRGFASSRGQNLPFSVDSARA